MIGVLDINDVRLAITRAGSVTKKLLITYNTLDVSPGLIDRKNFGCHSYLTFDELTAILDQSRCVNVENPQPCCNIITYG